MGKVWGVVSLKLVLEEASIFVNLAALRLAETLERSALLPRSDVITAPQTKGID